MNLRPMQMLRAPLRRINQSRRLEFLVREWRRLLPGDPDFGDPLSTAGSDAAHMVGRWTSSLRDMRLGIAAELGLAALQVADWLSEPNPRRDSPPEVAILFTDLVGFSSWALRAGDEASLELLREVDAVIAAIVAEHDGRVVKRLGDGCMAVFAEAERAMEAARETLLAVPEVGADGYEPRLRAGVHMGRPQSIGGDYIGVAVNVAARLCEAAEPNEILCSSELCDRVHGGLPVRRIDEGPRSGVPSELKVYRTAVDGDGDSGSQGRAAGSNGG